MLTEVALPLLALALAGWAVPWLWSKLLPEGVFWLVVIGVLSTATLVAGAALGFYLLYGASGEVVLDAAPWHFVVLSARAALVWGPVLVLSLANLPRHWKTAVW